MRELAEQIASVKPVLAQRSEVLAVLITSANKLLPMAVQWLKNG